MISRAVVQYVADEDLKSAHIRQSKPFYGPGWTAKVFISLEFGPVFLESGGQQSAEDVPKTLFRPSSAMVCPDALISHNVLSISFRKSTPP